MSEADEGRGPGGVPHLRVYEPSLHFTSNLEMIRSLFGRVLHSLPAITVLAASTQIPSEKLVSKDEEEDSDYLKEARRSFVFVQQLCSVCDRRERMEG